MGRREVARRAAIYREGSDRYRLGTALLQRGQRAPHRRTGIDDVVHDRDALAAQLALEGCRDRVGDRKQPGRLVVPHRLRVGEGHAERRGDHQSHERALDEGSTHRRDPMRAETVGKRFRQGLHTLRVQEQSLEVEPQLAVRASRWP
jgi:hypothetical protein